MKSIKSLVSKFLSFNLLNKYLIASLCFIVWLGFFDKYDYFTQKNLSNSLEDLQVALETKKVEIEEVKEAKMHLQLNKEKYAREKYLMHKENEEVFIIEK